MDESALQCVACRSRLDVEDVVMTQFLLSRDLSCQLGILSV